MSETRSTEYEQMVASIRDLMMESRCTTHEILDALIALSAKCIHTFAADRGAHLRGLEDQFCENLREAVCEYDHDEDYHA